jgi:hypothetical protein
MSLDLSKAQPLTERQANVRVNKTIQIGNLDFYLCPKCATNTIRYAKYKYDGGEQEVSDFRSVDNSYDILKIGDSSILGYAPERKDSIKVAVKKDPLERFISSLAWFNYKYEYNETVDSVINGLQKAINDNTYLSDIHFWTQSYFYGDPEKLDYIIYPSEITNLIKTNTGVDLGEIHKGQTLLPYVDLTDNQKEQLKEMYRSDYENGYC